MATAAEDAEGVWPLTARADFFAGRLDGAGLVDRGVPGPIVRSWGRSLAHGLDPGRPAVHRLASAARLAAARERNADLRIAAAGELRALADAWAQTPVGIALCDADLLTLDAVGWLPGLARELGGLVRAGVSLAERHVGTTAASVALAEGVSSRVHRHAHFLEAHVGYDSIAAPLREPAGGLIGGLCVTVQDGFLPAQAGFIVEAAACAIENQLFWLDERHVLIRFHPRADFVDSPLGGVLHCSLEGRIVAMNRAARAMLAGKAEGPRLENQFRLRLEDLLVHAGGLERFALDLITSAGTLMAGRVRLPGGGSRSDAGPAVRGAPAVGAAVSTAGQTGAGRAGAAVDRGGHPLGGALWTVVEVAGVAALAGARRAFEAGLPLTVIGEIGTGRSTVARALLGRSASEEAREGNAREGNAEGGAEESGDEHEPVAGGEYEAGDVRAFECALERAAGLGHLWLDDVGALPRVLQARLARWLDERRILGRVPPLIVTTDPVGLSCLAPGLGHRLGGTQLRLPALAERADRAGLIVSGLARAFGRRGRRPPSLSPESRRLLEACAWPGNLHELVALCEQLAALAPAGRELTPADLPASLAAHLPPRADERLVSTGAEAGTGRLREVERRWIGQALRRHRGNLSSVARELGVSRGTLYRRLRGPP